MEKKDLAITLCAKTCGHSHFSSMTRTPKGARAYLRCYLPAVSRNDLLLNDQPTRCAPRTLMTSTGTRPLLVFACILAGVSVVRVAYP